MKVCAFGVHGEAVRGVVGDIAKGISSTSQFAFLSMLGDVQQKFHRDCGLCSILCLVTASLNRCVDGTDGMTGGFWRP
jgi:hypothetical protein